MRLCRHNLQEIRQIAVGGMARLFLAVDEQGNEVVIRELHRSQCLKLRPHWRFRSGLRIRRALSPHPNIVAPYGSGYCGPVPYEIIEYVPGENLRESILKRDETIRAYALEILREVATALGHMHSQQLLHLDVKAENVLVCARENGDGLTVKLTDFDLSRKYGGGRERLRSGTASHMAPEQLTGGTVSYANDMFAFGVMAYYFVTGKMPFSGFSLDQVRKHQVSRKFNVVEPRRLNAALAPKLNWIIMRCLEKDRNDRFPNMAYLLQELGRI